MTRAARLLAASALALVLLATSLPAGAARFWRWQGEDGVTHYGDRPPEHAGNVAAESFHYRREHGPPVELRLVDRGSHHEVRAGNRLPGPVEVELRLARGDNVTGVPAMPVRTTLPASSETVVARLYTLDPRRGSSFDVVLEQMPGDPRARPLPDYEYRLPFQYARVRVDQGFGGRFSHDDLQNRHAVDFAVPEGTPVLAAREGVVLQVESDFAGTGLDRERYGGRANYVRILHADGSMALYAHLKPEGVLVRVGQRVRQGQQIALSGNTGFSTAPHLHFVVQVNRGMRLESIPFRMFGALGELDFNGAGPLPAP